MKRQSTTAKITRTDARRIMAECKDPTSGVIVRYRGTEYGVIRVVKTGRSYVAHTYEGVTIALSGCTMRKTTRPHLPADTQGEPVATPTPEPAPVAASVGTFAELIASAVPMDSTRWDD